MGLLLPGETLNESFIVYEGVHPGIHAIDTWHLYEKPTSKKAGKMRVRSYYTGKELEKLMEYSKEDFINRI